MRDDTPRSRDDALRSDTGFGTWVRNVWQIVAGIPRGHVLTYGEVARLAGPGGSARRVGQALRLAPPRLKLPWHRVVNAQGRISFAPESRDYAEQRRLLRREGVRFTAERIDLAVFGYAGALDRLLWGAPPEDP